MQEGGGGREGGKGTGRESSVYASEYKCLLESVSVCRYIVLISWTRTDGHRCSAQHH
jgi:hypothetical protein